MEIPAPAAYRADFCDGVTHVCSAFDNTPKTKDARKAGRQVYVVKGEWLLECKRTRRRAPEADFEFGAPAPPPTLPTTAPALPAVPPQAPRGGRGRGGDGNAGGGGGGGGGGVRPAPAPPAVPPQAPQGGRGGGGMQMRRGVQALHASEREPTVAIVAGGEAAAEAKAAAVHRRFRPRSPPRCR